MSLRNLVPNLFTSLNLLLGCLAVVEIFEGELTNVIYYTLLSGVADFFDGFFARILHATSKIGKDLDSLADVVSFGVAPALALCAMMQAAHAPTPYAYLPILIAVASAYRLAVFNHDTQQTDRFLGLPTPANALLLHALPLLAAENAFWAAVLQPSWVLAGIAVLSAALLVSRVPMLALKFTGYGWKANRLKYLFILLSLAGIAYYRLLAIPLLVGVYVVSSLAVQLIARIGKPSIPR